MPLYTQFKHDCDKESFSQAPVEKKIDKIQNLREGLKILDIKVCQGESSNWK